MDSPIFLPLDVTTASLFFARYFGHKNPEYLNFYYSFELSDSGAVSFWSYKEDAPFFVQIKNDEDRHIFDFSLLKVIPSFDELRNFFPLYNPMFFSLFKPDKALGYSRARRMKIYWLPERMIQKMPEYHSKLPVYCEEDYQNGAIRRLYKGMSASIFSSSGELSALAVSQFQCQQFVEVGVETHENHRRKGYGENVLRLLSSKIQHGGRIPVYITHADNHASLALCRKVGYQLYKDIWEFN